MLLLLLSKPATERRRLTEPTRRRLLAQRPGCRLSEPALVPETTLLTKTIDCCRLSKPAMMSKPTGRCWLLLLLLLPKPSLVLLLAKTSSETRS